MIGTYALRKTVSNEATSYIDDRLVVRSDKFFYGLGDTMIIDDPETYKLSNDTYIVRGKDNHYANGTDVYIEFKYTAGTDHDIEPDSGYEPTIKGKKYIEIYRPQDKDW